MFGNILFELEHWSMIYLYDVSIQHNYNISE